MRGEQLFCSTVVSGVLTCRLYNYAKSKLANLKIGTILNHHWTFLLLPLEDLSSVAWFVCKKAEMSLHPDERDPAIKLEDEESYQPTKTRPGALEVEYKPSQTGGIDTMLYPTLAEEEQSFLSQCQRDWLYPPNVPRECQLLRLENLAVPACYLVVGLLQGLSMPVMTAYPLDLHATEAQQVTVSTIRSLPASFKLIFGFISDNFPLGGYRRKSYMLLGWMLASVSILALMLSSNLTLAKDEGPPLDAPSIPGLSVSLLCFGTGFWLADVMGDSLVAEKAKIEIQKGQLQSTCYACRFFGIMVAAPLATYLYSLQPQYVFGLLCLVPLFMLPLIVILKEPRNIQVRPTSEQCNEIWNTVCSRAVWQPMAFVYVYNVLQVTNSPWKEFLRTGLGFSSEMINSISVVAYVLLFFGIMAYKYYFISWSWRSVYILTSLLNGVFSLGQILVINGKTFGLSPFLFAMGDDAFAEFNQGIQFLVRSNLLLSLSTRFCPSPVCLCLSSAHNNYDGPFVSCRFRGSFIRHVHNGEQLCQRCCFRDFDQSVANLEGRQGDTSGGGLPGAHKFDLSDNRGANIRRLIRWLASSHQRRFGQVGQRSSLSPRRRDLPCDFIPVYLLFNTRWCTQHCKPGLDGRDVALHKCFLANVSFVCISLRVVSLVGGRQSLVTHWTNRTISLLVAWETTDVGRDARSSAANGCRRVRASRPWNRVPKSVILATKHTWHGQGIPTLVFHHW